MAVANAESRAGLARLAEEQAALRRVATLVAQGVPPEELFAAVAEEVVNVLPVQGARIGRYESDGTVTYLATTTEPGDADPAAARLMLAGKNFALGGKNLATLVFETGGPARLDNFDDVSGPIGVAIRGIGGGSAVGTPIVVDGRLWGVATAGSTLERPLPPDTEARLTDFTELLATAIANAESRAGLAASRARIVAAADETSRRIQWDRLSEVVRVIVWNTVGCRSSGEFAVKDPEDSRRRVTQPCGPFEHGLEYRLQVDERDVRYVATGQRGTVAITGAPGRPMTASSCFLRSSTGRWQAT